MQTTFIDLGWSIGKLEINSNKDFYQLKIVSPSDVDQDTGYSCPAESVCIYGLGSLANLQKALNESLKHA